jgi:hypothetical protein
MSEVGKLVQLVDGHPLLHTVEEAAGVLRIGRTLAYALARRYETSDGRDGLPVVRVGNCLRVPHWALMELACNGRVVTLSELNHGRLRERPSRTPALTRPTVVRIVRRSRAPETRRSTSQSPTASRVAGSGRSRQLRSVEQLVLLPQG